MSLKKLTASSLLPGVEHIKKITFGAKASDSPDVTWPASDISAGTVLFKAPVGTLITNLRLHVRTAFGSTGSFTMDVGDATDADGWMESTDIVASDAGFKNMLSRQVGSTGALNAIAHKDGKLVSTGNTLDSDNLESVVVVTIGTAPLNAGLADFYVTYLNTSEFK